MSYGLISSKRTQLFLQLITYLRKIFGQLTVAVIVSSIAIKQRTYVHFVVIVVAYVVSIPIFFSISIEFCGFQLHLFTYAERRSANLNGTFNVNNPKSFINFSYQIIIIVKCWYLSHYRRHSPINKSVYHNSFYYCRVPLNQKYIILDERWIWNVFWFSYEKR